MTHSAISGGALAGETRTPCSHKPRWRRMRSTSYPTWGRYSEPHVGASERLLALNQAASPGGSCGAKTFGSRSTDQLSLRRRGATGGGTG